MYLCTFLIISNFGNQLTMKLSINSLNYYSFFKVIRRSDGKQNAHQWDGILKKG